MALMAVGLALFAYLIHKVGVDQVWRQLSLVGWWFVPVLLIGLCWLVCTCLAWSTLLRSFGHRVSLPYLLRLKMVSESVNVVLPAANVGGEGVRALMLRKRLPGDVAVGSVILDKTMDNIAKALFTIVGVAVSLLFVPIPLDWLYVAVIGLLIVVGFNTAVVVVQAAGVLGKTFPLMTKAPWLGRKIQTKRAQFESLDAHLRTAYLEKRGVLLLSLLWHLARRALNVAEVWLILWLLTGDGSLEKALFITALTTAASNAFVLVPGKWGVIEGVQVVLAEFVGYASAVGVGLGVTRRIRQLVFTGLGLFLARGFR